MCMDIRLFLDACTSERRRGARVGVRLRRVRARVRARWGASASRHSRRSERTGVPITHAGACLGHAWRLSMASARSSARPPIVARRARAARARGARQVHLLHEGEGAPRVARPVQALGVAVRPAAPPPPCAFAAVPALRCCAWRCRAGRWGRAARRWMRRRRRCRSSAAAEPCARMAGARGRPARGTG
jgi:hypothetical protein